MLDAAGTPRLRVAPPYIVGADGARTDATLAVEGCAVDSDPAAPWGRPVITPGAASCTVKVSWPDDGVAYPAVLDPKWTTTGSMTTPRQGHTATLLSTGKVLVVGGTSNGTTALASAELYDRVSGTWSVTAGLTGARTLHTATQLNTSSNGTTSGKVLIAGGRNGSTSQTTAQLYSPTAGTWTAAANLNAARDSHTATLLADGRVLVAGGVNGTAALQTAALYNPASGIGTWTATTGPIPPGALKNHTATLLVTANMQLSNKVLLVGGNNGTGTVATVFLFDPAQSAFSTLNPLSSPREGHTATTLANGNLLVAGGKNGSTALATTMVFNPSVSMGSWSSAGNMTTARTGHSATLLSSAVTENGTVLVAGGTNGSSALSSAELWNGTTTWTATIAMPAAVQGHTATLLANGSVLIAGGINGSTTLSAARLYDGSAGLGCTSGSQCTTGFCVSGVCCDTACTDQCSACNLTGLVGTCSPLANGTLCRAQAGACDVAETCNGTALTCPTDGFAPATTVCRAANGECDVAETCTGSSASCPTDAKKASGTACTDDGNACTKDQCDGSNVTCQHPAGNAGTVCRASAGICDVAETCTGTSTTCPADGFASASTVCRAAGGECDVAETCTGSSASCPADVKKTSGTACTDDGNVCTKDQCDGSNVLCQHPAGNAGTVCRAKAGDCDVAESCTGTSGTCPTDGFLSGSTVCRASAGECDAAETCTGSSASCPTDAKKPGATPCADDGNVCTKDQCDGTNVLCQHPAGNAGTVCRAKAGDCDVAESCTGSSPTCPADGKVSDGTTCNDGDACTTADACHGGTCFGTTVTCSGADQCHSVGACVSATGCPAPVAEANGTTCDDGNACTTGDSCQAGSCVSGASTCVTITLFRNPGSHESRPNVDFEAAANPTTVVPGDLVTFTTTATNVSLHFGDDGFTELTNPGTTPFTIGSYQQTLEYFSLMTQTWVPFAKVSFDSTGTEVDDPNLVVIQAPGLFGATVPPGGAPIVPSYSIDATLPPDLANLVSDPTQVNGVRDVLHIDTGSGTPGVSADVDVSDVFTTEAVSVDDVTEDVQLHGQGTTSDLVTLTGPGNTIAPGATLTSTGSLIATPFLPRDPTETDGQYIGRINSPFYAAFVDFNAPRAGTSREVIVNTAVPVLSIQKSGPAQGNAGLTLPYPVQLHNIGLSTAGPFNIVDTVNGNDVGAEVVAPATIAAGATGTATVNAASPLGQAPGPYSDQVAVTWQDRNGNVYGPLASSFTTNLTAGHPEGYLTLSTSGVTAAQILGSSVTLTATALDSLGHPVAGLPVQLVITGSNGQTVPLVIGPDGTASFTYDGPNLGADTATITATINGPTLQASVPAVTWSTQVGTPCTGRGTPLDVMLLVDNSPSMFTEDTVAAAKAAAAAFIGDLDPALDQVGGTVFMGFATLDAQLTNNFAQASSVLTTAIQQGVDDCTGFCSGGTGFFFAFQVAQTELQGPRHRPGATPVVVLLSDGANTGPDYAAELAAVKAAGIRVITLGFGTDVDVAAMRSIASSPNDYFYAPSAGELGWTYSNIVQDTCRNVPPLVSAGGDQGLYEVRLPAVLTLQGEAHGSGTRGDLDLTSTWTEVSGPAPVAFADPSSPVTDVVFTEPGTYVLQLEVSDGFMTTAVARDRHRRSRGVARGGEPGGGPVVAGPAGRRNARDADGDVDRRAGAPNRQLRRSGRRDRGEPRRRHADHQRLRRRDLLVRGRRAGDRHAAGDRHRRHGAARVRGRCRSAGRRRPPAAEASSRRAGSARRGSKRRSKAWFRSPSRPA